MKHVGSLSTVTTKAAKFKTQWLLSEEQLKLCLYAKLCLYGKIISTFITSGFHVAISKD